MAEPARVAPRRSRRRRRTGWSPARRSGRTCAPSSSTCASRKALPSSVWRGSCPIFSAFPSARARWSTYWTPPVTPSRARRAASAPVSCREPSCNQMRPACGSANGTGGCGCSTMRTAPSSKSNLRVASVWFRPFSASFGPTSGCPTGMAPRWAGQQRKTRSASPISSATCNTPSTRASASSRPGASATASTSAPAQSAPPRSPAARPRTLPSSSAAVHSPAAVDAGACGAAASARRAAPNP